MKPTEVSEDQSLFLELPGGLTPLSSRKTLLSYVIASVAKSSSWSPHSARAWPGDARAMQAAAVEIFLQAAVENFLPEMPAARGENPNAEGTVRDGVRRD